MIKCLAVDDEPLALKLIVSYIEKTPFLKLSGQASNAFEAMEHLTNYKTDLIFIDINMPEMSGMEFVKTLPAGTNIIFTTAYSEFGAESYQVNTIDYLLKPISYDDFLKAANKAKERISAKPEKQESETSDHFFVKSEGRFVKVFFSDIQYIESLSEYVEFHLAGNRDIKSLMRLKDLISVLPEKKFMRVHRSFIVNLDSIDAVERQRIIIGKNRIPVSDQYKDDFNKFLENITV